MKNNFQKEEWYLIPYAVGLIGGLWSLTHSADTGDYTFTLIFGFIFFVVSPICMKFSEWFGKKSKVKKSISTKNKTTAKIADISPEKKYRVARKIDNWEEINKKRKETGDKGESVVFVLEQEYLESINRKDLSDKVRHVSKEDGDGLGYDILSFFEDGREKYIEVKSTTTSVESQFNISKNEFEFLKEHNDDAFIYRVSFSNETPEVKVKTSSDVLESDIVPMSYKVRMK